MKINLPLRQKAWIDGGEKESWLERERGMEQNLPICYFYTTYGEKKLSSYRWIRNETKIEFKFFFFGQGCGKKSKCLGHQIKGA